MPLKRLIMGLGHTLSSQLTLKAMQNGLKKIANLMVSGRHVKFRPNYSRLCQIIINRLCELETNSKTLFRLRKMVRSGWIEKVEADLKSEVTLLGWFE